MAACLAPWSALLSPHPSREYSEDVIWSNGYSPKYSSSHAKGPSRYRSAGHWGSWAAGKLSWRHSRGDTNNESLTKRSVPKWRLNRGGVGKITFWQLDLISLTGRPLADARDQSLNMQPLGVERTPVVDKEKGFLVEVQIFQGLQKFWNLFLDTFVLVVLASRSHF